MSDILSKETEMAMKLIAAIPSRSDPNAQFSRGPSPVARSANAVVTPLRRNEAIFSTVSRTGLRTEDFRGDLGFTDDGSGWTVMDPRNGPRSLWDMLNQGYRWEKSETIQPSSPVFEPSSLMFEEQVIRTFYTRHLANVEIRHTGMGPHPVYSAYLVDGSAHVIDPIPFFRGLGIRGNIHDGTVNYLISRDSSRIVIVKVRVDGLFLDNILVREVNNKLGALLGFSLGWEGQSRTSVITFRGAETTVPQPTPTPAPAPVIPPPTPTPPPPVVTPPLNIISRIEWGALPPASLRPFSQMSNISIIVIHHTDTTATARFDPGATTETVAQRVRSIDNHHRNNNGWSGGIAYHFLIGYEGSIFEGRPLNSEGTHARGRNSRSVGIALIGRYYPGGTPPQPQLDSLFRLIEHIKTEIPSAQSIERHHDKCPGPWFDDYF